MLVGTDDRYRVGGTCGLSTQWKPHLSDSRDHRSGVNQVPLSG